MNMSNEIANMILRMLENDGFTEIQRNELAQTIGCVPSQINYVISSRFTPEHGYIVESRRGGGGYVRISRVSYDKGSALMHVVNSIGLRRMRQPAGRTSAILIIRICSVTRFLLRLLRQPVTSASES